MVLFTWWLSLCENSAIIVFKNFRELNRPCEEDDVIDVVDRESQEMFPIVQARGQVSTGGS